MLDLFTEDDMAGLIGNAENDRSHRMITRGMTNKVNKLKKDTLLSNRSRGMFYICDI